jgi:hypothetical protein
MLGLTDTYRFLDIDKDDEVSAIDAVEKADAEIQRFQSPVRIKIIGDYIALIPGEVPEAMLHRDFAFVAHASFSKNPGEKSRYGDLLKNGKELPEDVKRRKAILTTPEEFDVAQFLDEFANDFNSAKTQNILKNASHRDFRRVAGLSLNKWPRSGVMK